MRKVCRKCTWCQDKRVDDCNIYIDNEKYIYNGTAFFHYNCYLDYCKESHIPENKIAAKAEEMYQKTLKNNTIHQSFNKDRFYYWLSDKYEINVFPKNFYVKVQKIVNGTFSNNILVGISYEDLLCIFKKMEKSLNKTYQKNIREGKSFDSLGRLNYDLAIVLNNYDNYIKWKKKLEKQKETQEDIQKEAEITSKDIQEEQFIESNKTRERKEEVSILDLLEDCF